MAKKRKRTSGSRATATPSAAMARGKKTRRTVRFDYIKSNCFRVIRVDGVHGSPTPKGEIQVAFFSERHAIPKSEEYVLEKGKLGKRIDITARGAIVREVEVEAILSVEMARLLEAWLHQKIEEIGKLHAGVSSNG